MKNAHDESGYYSAFVQNSDKWQRPAIVYACVCICVCNTPLLHMETKPDTVSFLCQSSQVATIDGSIVVIIHVASGSNYSYCNI